MSSRPDRYREKRDFDTTPEPRGDARKTRHDGPPRFVIQRHDATNEHYDVRLEVAGILKSWAVPKGPSTDPAEKRLAIPTEDHPLEYADFEGTIPEDEYGGGTVMIWDRGTFENRTRNDDGPVPLDKAVAQGHVVVDLDGEKLSGGYALQRADVGDDDQENWLLVKTRDDDADARRRPTSTQEDSAASGRSMEEIADEADED